MRCFVTINLWDKILSSLESDINKQSFDMWLKNSKPIARNDTTFTIEVNDDVTRRHISEQYSIKIEELLKNITEQNLNLEIIIKNAFNKNKDNANIEKKVADNISLNSLKNNDVLLNPKYTFQNFIIGPNNQLAHAAANAVANAPATQFNPLFVYGATGLGKTHLMHAIGHHIISEKPFLKVLYVPTEQFINEFIQAIMSNTQASFKIKYRNVDILMIDDIQFIEKKRRNSK